MTKIAIFHDNFAQMGGAERVAAALHRILPQAAMHSTLAVWEKLSPQLRNSIIQTTWMQRLPSLNRLYRHYFLLYPLAVQTADLSQYDVLISSCFGYAKGIRRNKNAVHICYCHTPPRWIWRYGDYTKRERFGLPKRLALPVLLSGLKRWDLSAARQPDHFIANSQVVAQRIQEFYGRPAAVIPPPIEVDRFQVTPDQEDYYLVLARLVPYKRIDIAIQACNLLQRRLVIIGDGTDRNRLEQLAGRTIQFMGRLSDDETSRIASRCRALLFPGEEDFGMVPLELAAAGRPTIAFRAGGATETIIEGRTGLFFDEPDARSLAEAILNFETFGWDPHLIRAHARQFDIHNFRERFHTFLNSLGLALPMAGFADGAGFEFLPEDRQLAASGKYQLAPGMVSA